MTRDTSQGGDTNEESGGKERTKSGRIRKLTYPLAILFAVGLVLALFVIFAGGVALPLPGGGPELSGVAGSASSAELDLSRVEVEVYTTLNEVRAANGKDQLSLSATLSSVAMYHNKHMVRHGYFGYEGPEGTAPRDRFLQFGYLCTRKGGSLLYRAPPRGTPEAFADRLVDKFATKSESRQTLLGRHTATGIAAYAVDDKIYVTLTFC